MTPIALSDIIAVGEVPTREQIAILAEAGFRSLLNAQPDGEVERHLSSAEAYAEASRLGMTYRHIPVLSRRPDDRDVEAFAQALQEMPRPIYACCYSGSRAAAVWALAAARTNDVDSIVAACAAAGFDTTFLRPELDRRHADAAAPSKITPVQAPSHQQPTGETVAVPPAPAAPVPQLVSTDVIPRAASAGGFAVAG